MLPHYFDYRNVRTGPTYRSRPSYAVLLCALGVVLGIGGVNATAFAGEVSTAPHASMSVGAQRPRIVVSTDIPPLDVIPGGLGYGAPEKRSDPDDLQSMVRFLTYADEFDVEALIASSGTLANIANKQNLFDMLDVYAKVEPQLRANSDAYPTADYLRKRCFQGLSGSWGKAATELLGADKDTEASQNIIRIVDESDAPTWFVFWGGTRELAQALWRVKRDRSSAEAARFISKVRVYMIAHQDGTGAWLEDTFPDLFIIRSDAYLGMALGGDTALSSGEWLEKNVRNQGPLGAAYPLAAWSGQPGMQEGDSPSILYLISSLRGLTSLNDPTLGGWGGRFQATTPGGRHFVDAPEGGQAIARWRADYQNDFLAQLARTVKGPAEVNHRPVAVVDGDEGSDVLTRELAPDGELRLSAKGSRDPDGNTLTYRWSVYPEADAGALTLDGADSAEVVVRAAKTDIERSAQLVLEVRDSGVPPLVSYRRVQIKVMAH